MQLEFCLLSKIVFAVTGTDRLTVTWKVTDGIMQHIDVREEGKENAFSLGSSLWIDNQVSTIPKE